MTWFLIYYLVGLVSIMHVINVDASDGCMTGENPLLVTIKSLLIAVFAPA